MADVSEPGGFAVCPDPDCQQIAEVVDDYVLESTAGPLRHIVTHCLARHHLTHVVEAPLT